MTAPSTPWLRRRRLTRAGWAVGTAIIVAAIEVGVLVLTPGAGMVLVNSAYFQIYTPPTNWCPFWQTSGGPPPVFEVRTGSIFRLSWLISCEPYGPGNTTGATFVLSSVASSSLGYTVVASNVPVVFGYDTVGYVNVSVRAPSWDSYSTLVLIASGGPDSAF